MTGAEVIVETLLNAGINLCFANPGTSEMHFIAALDKVPGMRCVLGLFEGVATGAADGYFRMTRRPACTLLHLAPGFTNGASNLHNAMKARSGIVNIVGQHATYHLGFDAPLTADVEGAVGAMSHWWRTCQSAADAATDTTAAIEAAMDQSGQIASLIVCADASWQTAKSSSHAAPHVAAAGIVSDAAVFAAAELLGQPGKHALYIGGQALGGEALDWAGRIAVKTGCQLLAPGQNALMERGAGRVAVSRLQHDVDLAAASLADVEGMVLAGAPEPVAFFAYPGKPSLLKSERCELRTLASRTDDVTSALRRLAAALDAIAINPQRVARVLTARPSGPITSEGIGIVLAAMIPDNCVVVDESISMGRGFAAATVAAAPHWWMNSTGASLGYALPVAIGAAIAAPESRILALVGDGSAMYTLQALWTMVRENLNITIVILANRSYNVLRGELQRVGVATPGPIAIDMLTLDRPALDWVALAKGHGVEAISVDTLEALADGLDQALAATGPRLIEVICP